MRKSPMLSSALGLLMIFILTTSQIVAFGLMPVRSQSSSSNPKSSPKKTRKKKKQKTRTSTLGFTPILRVPTRTNSGMSPASPVTTSRIQTINSPTIPSPTTRGGTRAARIPGPHILPANPNLNIASQISFSNAVPITIDSSSPGPDPTPADPYPSEIDVDGITQSIDTVSITLNGLSHTFVDNLDMLLVGPGGQAFHFWSDVGGSGAVSDLTVTVADSGASPLPDDGPLTSGTYKPFNADTNLDTFPSPAPDVFSEPAPAGSATFTSVFHGLSGFQANGTWRLYVTDDLDDDLDSGGGSIAGGWSLDITEFNPPTAAGQLLISEFRLRGAAGANDEFIELYNGSGGPLTVQAADESSGLAVAASDGVARCVVPNGTVIPRNGHFLCVNSVAYGYGTYPAGDGTTATGDLAYTTDIPDNAGIAIFNNSTGGTSFSLANRLDAVGSTSEANTLYKEGTGYPALTPSGIVYSFYRDMCGKGGSITTMGPCPTGGAVKDTDNNAADFIFIDTNGTSAGAGQRLGAPGPENLSGPVQRNADLPASLIAPCVAASAEPNRVRDFTSSPMNNSTFGTLAIRRQFMNTTGENVSRLRFRVVDISTFPAPSGIADLRPRSSVDSTETNPECNGGGTVDVVGLTLEQVGDPQNQPNGGGFNSSLGAGTITLATPLPPNGTINVTFLLGIQQTGSFKFYVNVEALTSPFSPDRPSRP